MLRLLGLLGVLTYAAAAASGYDHGQGYVEKAIYHGKYHSKCDSDGFYFFDDQSYIVCHAGTAFHLPCAPGTRNSDYDSYKYGGDYKRRDFCDVNLVDYGYSVDKSGDGVNKYDYGYEAARGYEKKDTYAVGNKNGGSRNNGYYDNGYDSHGDNSYDNQADGYGNQADGYGNQADGYGNRNSGYGKRNSGYDNRNSGYGKRNNGYNSRNSGYGNRGYDNDGYGYNRGYGNRRYGYNRRH